MKKKGLVFAVLLLVMVFCAGCGEKTAMTDESFRSTMEEQGFNVYDVSKIYSNNNEVKTAMAAVSSDNYQIEFIIYDNVDIAELTFDAIRDGFEHEKPDKAGEHSYTSGPNYEKYSQTYEESYWYVNRVDNTVMRARIPSKYENTIKFLEDL